MKEKRAVIKVAHVIGSLNIGGAERFIIDLSLAQKALGIKPAVISLGEPNEPLVAVCHTSNIPVASYAGHSIIKLCRAFLVLMKFDVIHIHSPHALNFIRMFLPILNKKIVYTRHGASPLTSEHWCLFHKKIKPFVSAITFVSQEGSDNFHQQHGWADIPSYVIDNGVLIDPIDKRKQQDNVLRIGSVGRMHPLKNQKGLLQAIQLLSQNCQSNLELHFFGDGECLTELTAFHKANLPHVNVNFHGMVNDRKVIYSRFDVLVVTSETEGLSMVIIEAMANKIPVIATDVGGNPKLVVHGKTGWLFDYDDHQKLADHIQMLFDNDDLLVASGDNAFTYISDNFSINNSAKKYAELYLQ